MSRPRYTLVHLDLDGTVIDSRADLAASTNVVREHFGLAPLAPESVYALVGRGARVLVERALGPERSADVDEAVRVFLAHYREHCLDETRPYDGIVNVVDALRESGVELSVVTNKPEALAVKILAGLDLENRLVGVIGGDTMPTRKPEPAGVERIRTSRGVERRDCLMVGDSVVDVETAERAGIDSCGVLWGLDPRGVREARPSYLVASPDELLGVVRGGRTSGSKRRASVAGPVR